MASYTSPVMGPAQSVYPDPIDIQMVRGNASNASAAAFQLAVQHIERVASTRLVPPQHVEAIASTLLERIQKSPDHPSDQPVQEAEIADWMERVKWVDDSQLSVMAFLNIRGYLGAGGESYVYMGIMNQGKVCAVKKMIFAKNEQELKRRDTLLKRICQNPYLVHYYGSTPKYMFEEFCSESLSKLCEKAFEGKDPASLQQLDRQLYPFIEQILVGVASMHERDVVHCDIKLENILLSESGEGIRISDLAGAVDISESLRASTLCFSAPEHSEVLTNFGQTRVFSSKDPKKSEVWQTMLVIAQISKNQLSSEFRNRIEAYIEECAVSQAFAESLFLPQDQDVAEDEEDGIEEQELTPEQRASIAECYGYAAKCSLSNMKDLRAQQGLNCDGLFSDLVPNNNLEKLLVRMSTFEPEERMSAEEALEFFKQYGAVENQ